MSVSYTTDHSDALRALNNRRRRVKCTDPIKSCNSQYGEACLGKLVSDPDHTLFYHNTQCKPCRAAYHRAYKRQHRDHVKSKNKEYRARRQKQATQERLAKVQVLKVLRSRFSAEELQQLLELQMQGHTIATPLSET